MSGTSLPGPDRNPAREQNRPPTAEVAFSSPFRPSATTPAQPASRSGRPTCRTSYENVAGQGVTARGSLRKPVTGFPLTRVLRHTASQPAGRFVDWMVQRQTCATSREVSARKGTDTADDQSRQCHLPQRLHTPAPNVPAGQGSQSPASTVAWTQFPGVFRADSAPHDPDYAFPQLTGLRPEALGIAKTTPFRYPTGYMTRASEPRFRSSEALSGTWWQVKDSNLRSFRDGFTVPRLRACDQRKRPEPQQLPYVFRTDSRRHPWPTRHFRAMSGRLPTRCAPRHGGGARHHAGRGAGDGRP